MTFLFICLSGLLFGLGLYLTLCGVSKTPAGTAEKALRKIEKHARAQDAPEGLEALFLRAARPLTPLIRLDTYRRAELEAALEFAGMDCAPEAHVARAVAVGLCALVLPLAGLMLCLFDRTIGIVISCVLLGLAVYMGFNEYNQVHVRMRRRKRILEGEIPQFAATISELLLHREHIPVIDILTEYRKMAGPSFRRELDRTIADMKTSNMESALLRMDHRIASAHMSEVVRGLIGILRGDDEVIYFQTIAANLHEAEIAEAKKRASIEPDKVRKKSMALVFCSVAMIMVMLGMILVDSFSSLSGW